MFFIVFFAFAQLGYLLFGTQVKDYSSFGKAVYVFTYFWHNLKIDSILMIILLKIHSFETDFG